MERLKPRHETFENMSLDDILKLPVAVVIAKGKDVKIYKIESKDVRKYFHSLKYDGRHYPFKDVLEVTERLGKAISEDELLKASGFMPESPYLSSEGSYAMYKVKFKKKEITLKS